MTTVRTMTTPKPNTLCEKLTLFKTNSFPECSGGASNMMCWKSHFFIWEPTCCSSFEFLLVSIMSRFQILPTNHSPVTWNWLGFFHTRSGSRVTAHVWLARAWPGTPTTFWPHYLFPMLELKENEGKYIYIDVNILEAGFFFVFVSLANGKLQHYDSFRWSKLG